MKVLSLAAVILLAGTVAFAQKSDPLVKKYQAPRAIKHNTSGTPLPKSENADVVAAALKRKSSTPSDLAQIERSSVVKTASRGKPARVPNDVSAYKNKPMNGSNSNGKPKRVPTVHKKTH